MGKIADALERHKKETSINVDFLAEHRPERSISEKTEISFAKDFCTIHDCSPKLIALSAADSLDAEKFRVLRGQILFARDRQKPRTIMVTSPLPGEGKTFVAANLAVSIALGIDEYVLLVDCDLRHPNLHEMFHHKNGLGLAEHLTGEKQLEELMIRTQIEKLSLLPAGNAISNPAELLSSSAMESFIEEVKGRYPDRFIVIDSAPCEITSEAKVLARYMDTIILVVMALKSPRRAVQKTVDNLGKEKVLGIFFNGYDTAGRNYGKYYDKYYKGK